MKNKFRCLLAISTCLFWLCFANTVIPGFIIFSVFGLGAGILIAKCKPLSELNWPGKGVAISMWLLSGAFSAIVCFCTMRFFMNTWSNSPALLNMISRLHLEPNVGLTAVALLMGLGIFPSVFDVIYRALYHAWNLLTKIHWAALWHYTAQTVSLRSSCKNALLITVSLLLCACIGIGLLTAVYCIPTDSIEKNIAQSALTIQKEGTYYPISIWFHSQLDNWTDSIILMEAGIGGESNAFQSAITASHGTIKHTTSPTDSLLMHYIDGQPYTSTVEYCRYWHGYLIFIKPLLSLMDYSSIRILNGIIQISLIIAICCLMYRKGLRDYVLPFILMYLMLMPAALAYSIQFSTCFYVIILAIIGLLVIRSDKLDRFAAPVFLMIGIATAYFDFLTYPMATFGIPVLMLMVLQASRPLEEKLFWIVKCGLFWSIGFGGMWASKWVISHIACGYPYSYIFSIVAARTSLSGTPSLFDTEALNYVTMLHTPVSWLVLLLIGFRCFKIRKQESINPQAVYRTVLPYILVACAPVVWFAFAANHSFIHYWFTNKACSITLLGILFAVTNVQTLRPKS